MTDEQWGLTFSTDERAALHALAEMFRSREDRDRLRDLMQEGATLKQLVTAYRSQKYLLTAVKVIAGLIVVVGGAWAAIRGVTGGWAK